MCWVVDVVEGSMLEWSYWVRGSVNGHVLRHVRVLSVDEGQAASA